MWDLVPWPGIEPGPPELGARSLIHCATREVPLFSSYNSLFKKILVFWCRFMFTSKLRGRYRDFPYTPCLHTCIASPIINTPDQMVHLLQLMNLHWHIIITQSPQFTLGFTHGVVHCMALDKCMMTCNHHYSIIQSIFTILKTLYALPIHPFPPSPTSGNHLSLYHLHSFAFSRMSWVESYST